MTDKATLSYGDRSWDLNVHKGTEQEVGIDISKMRGETGLITLDVGYANTGACQSAITFIDGERGSCATEVTRLSNWRRTLVSLRWPTCSFTASYQHKTN